MVALAVEQAEEARSVARAARPVAEAEVDNGAAAATEAGGGTGEDGVAAALAVGGAGRWARGRTRWRWLEELISTHERGRRKPVQIG